MINNFFSFSLNVYSHIIQSDYVFYGIPHHGNAGDMMILEAELDILKQIKYNCLLYGNQYNYEKINLTDKTVLISGSGSYGDVDNDYINKFINKIICDYDNNDILIFPSSMYWKKEENIVKHANILKQHKGNIHLCCRDINSYNFAIKHFGNISNVKLYLLPDVVLTWNINDFIKKHNIQIPGKIKNTLYISRNDNEKNIIYDKKIDDKQDWPTLSIGKYIQKHIDNVSKDIWLKYIKDEILIDAISFVLPYKTVVSDRMHGFVLAMLLDKQSILLDNTYHKCSGLYNTWIKNNNFNNTSIITSN